MTAPEILREKRVLLRLPVIVVTAALAQLPHRGATWSHTAVSERCADQP
jgi:hypothetical protein